MKHLKLCVALAIAAVAATQFVTPTPARADTYQIIGVNTDDGVYFYGMDSSGQVVLATGLDYCGGQYSTCYGHDGDWSGIAPTLSLDNGATCTPSLPAGTSDVSGVCNNGRSSYYGYFDANSDVPGLYSFLGSNPPQLIYSGFLTGRIYMNGLGDIVFDDGELDSWDEAIDLTTLPAPTPEPSTLFLLATGLLGTGFIVRQRRIA